MAETSDNTDRPDASEPLDDGGGVDIRQYVSMLWAHKWIILITTVVVSAGVIGWTLNQPRIYEATCTIEYDPNPARPLGDQMADVSSPVGSFWMNQEFFATQNRIISSRDVAESAVEAMNLNHQRWFYNLPENAPFEPRSVESAARTLRSRLTVEEIDGTRLVEIRVRHQSAQHAAELANGIALAYIAKTTSDGSLSTEEALVWLESREDELEDQLEESEMALHRFRVDNHVLAVSMEDRQNLVAAEIQSFNSALTEARTRRISLQARLARIRAAANAATEEESAAAFPDSETLSGLSTSLRAKVAERQSLDARYGPNHVRMTQIEAQLSDMRRQVSDEIAGMLRAAAADVAEIRQVESGLRASLEQAHDQGLALNLAEIEFSGLSRNQENNSKLYTVVLESHTQTELQHRQHTVSHARLLDAALPPRTPVSPNLTVNSLGGVGAGLALGLALTLLLSQLDRRLRSVAEVERLGLTVLGILPRIEEGDEAQPPKRARRKKRKLEPLPAGGRDLIVHSHPMSAAAECCRAIRTNLTFLSANEPIRSLVVSSADPREGKTMVISNIAISLAQSGKRVLLVDTDLRRPRIHRAFGVGASKGITSVIVGEEKLENAIQPTEIAGLDVLACGPIPPNPSELLHSGRFRELLDEAYALYDRVIFDSPPLRAVTDAAVIAPQVDGVMLVVKAQETTRDALKSALRQLRDVGANVVGGVLNDIDPKRQGYGYADNHYYYYRREGYYYKSDEDEDDDAPTVSAST